MSEICKRPSCGHDESLHLDLGGCVYVWHGEKLNGCKCQMFLWEAVDKKALQSGEWLDEVVIERVLHGKPPGRGLTIAERKEAIERLFWQGLSLNEIAERIQMTDRAVTRWLRKLNLREKDRTIHPKSWVLKEEK